MKIEEYEICEDLMARGWQHYHIRMIEGFNIDVKLIFRRSDKKSIDGLARTRPRILENWVYNYQPDGLYRRIIHYMPRDEYDKTVEQSLATKIKSFVKRMWSK